MFLDLYEHKLIVFDWLHWRRINENERLYNPFPYIKQRKIFNLINPQSYIKWLQKN